MKVDLILTSDWHIRETVPECRTDDFFEAMIVKTAFLKELQEQYECPIICAGDVFDKAKSSPWLNATAMKIIPKGTWAIPGQHDLPNHSMKLIGQSNFYLMVVSKTLNYHEYYSDRDCQIHTFPFGAKLKGFRRPVSHRRIAVCHTFVWPKKKPFPDAVGHSAEALMQKMPGFDLIVTGDNHQGFTVKTADNRLVVNPGSMMRTAADQADYRPRVYLWNAEENEVDIKYYPIEKGVVSREHIDRVEERDDRIDSFVSRLRDDVEIGFSFEKNMEEYLVKNKVEKDVQEIIWENVQ